MNPPSDQPDDLREIARKLLRAADLMDLPMVRETYSAEDRIVALRPNSGGMIISEPYHGGPFDPLVSKVVKGGWDHEHCSMCAARVLPGDEWWATLPPHQAGLCFDCHDILVRSSDALRSAGLAADRGKPRLARERFAPMTEAEWVASKTPRAMLMSLKDREEARTIDRKLRLFACACVRRAWHLLADDRSRRMVEVAERYADGLATPEELDAAEDESTSASGNLYVSGGLQADDDARIAGLDPDGRATGAVFGERPAARAWRAACAAERLAARKLGRAGVPGWFEGGAWVAALVSSRLASDAIADAALLRAREADSDAAEFALDRPILASDPIAAAVQLRARRAADETASERRTFYEEPWQADLLRCHFGNPHRPIAIDLAWLTPSSVVMTRSIYEDRSFGRLPELAESLEAAGCRDVTLLAHCRQSGQHARGCWVVDAILGKS